MEAIRLKVACSVVCVHLVMCSISIEHDFTAAVVVLVQLYCFVLLLFLISFSVENKQFNVFCQKFIAQEAHLKLKCMKCFAGF